jgi:hypothetical protein
MKYPEAFFVILPPEPQADIPQAAVPIRVQRKQKSLQY